MGCAANLDLEICMGATWRRVVQWSAEPYVYKQITAVPQLAPLRLTVTGHGMIDEQRAAITDVKGMKQLNAPDEPPEFTDYHAVKVIDANTLEFNDINATSYSAYTSGGILRYLTLIDLTGYFARMDIKDKIGGTILLTLSTTNGRITIDNVTKKITLLLTDEETELFTWKKGVYTLEMESAGGEVYPLITGKVTVMREVTTTETP